MRIRGVLFVSLLMAAIFGSMEPGLAQSGTATGTGDRAAAELRAGDVLRISVWPNTELSGEFTIEEDGYVYLPLLAEVRAAGISVDNLRADLRRRYGEVQRNPVVTVTPMFRVSVTGAVQRPGIHMITPTTSLLDVIVMAGGFQSGADSENVRIVRPGQVTDYNALRALETGDGMEAIQLRSGDHIVVPPRRPARLTLRNAFEAVRTISTVLLIWDRFFR